MTDHQGPPIMPSTRRLIRIDDFRPPPRLLPDAGELVKQANLLILELDGDAAAFAEWVVAGRQIAAARPVTP